MQQRQSSVVAGGAKGGKKKKGKGGNNRDKDGKKKDPSKGKCVGWIDYAVLDSNTKVPPRSRLDAAQKALMWYERALRIIDEDTVKDLAKDASASKVSWEVAVAMQTLNLAVTRMKTYKEEAKFFITDLEQRVNQMTINRGFFSKTDPNVRAQYGDLLYQLFQANNAVYGNKKIDIFQFFALDHNTSIRERITQKVITGYAAAGMAVPIINLSSKPVRLLYNMQNDLFFVFYGIDGSQSNVPWVGYAIRITDENLVDWSLPENIYYDREFSMFTDVNNRNSPLVDIPLTPPPAAAAAAAAFGGSAGGAKGAKGAKGGRPRANPSSSAPSPLRPCRP